MTPTAQSVLETFERRWETLLDTISPAAARDPKFRLPMRSVYLGAALSLLSAGVTSLDPAQAQRLGDTLAEEALEIMRRHILERARTKGPVQ